MTLKSLSTAPWIVNHVKYLQVVVGFASLTSATFLWAVEDDKKQQDSPKKGARRVPDLGSRMLTSRPLVTTAVGSSSMKSSNILATSASTSEEAATPTSRTDGRSVGQSNSAGQEVKTRDYDFVVLGNGNAGLRAVRTLREECPNATIALVDPLRPITSTTNKLQYLPHYATSFDPVTQTVQLSHDDTDKLRYRHGILVATGSRGAPPPPSLLDDETVDRILELRPTVTSMDGGKRPVMSPKAVRQFSLLAASQGARVGVMGSGWEAVELAVAAASVGKQAPMLSFGSAGPLGHVLPRYLSTAVTKRLRQQGIDVQQRSLVRYVAAEHQGKSTPRIEVHSAKSYDMLDTQRTSVDLLVVAPHVDGPRGTAILPTSNAPKHFESISIGHPWFQSWSQLTSAPLDPSIVVCFDDDGRIMVNAELQAASRVYAAGSVAKYPNSLTGHAHVAGEGGDDGAVAGRFAALCMAREYTDRKRNIFSGLDGRRTRDRPMSFAAESFPISRSDVCSYIQDDSAKSNFLSSIGITALCVGQCDSERMSTHGFWWTNQSAHRLALNQAEGESTRRRTTRRQTRTSSPKDVFGVGVVFYLDRNGRIKGVMTWGLPFAVAGELNESLASRMKEIIVTNGGISQLEAAENNFLHSFHLEEESKKLVALSLSRRLARRNTSSNMQRLMVPVENMGKPLHRYTAAKPSSVSGMQTVRRKDNSQGDAPGENLYVKDEDTEFESLRPPTLLYVYPMDSSHYSGPESGRDAPFLRNDQERLKRVLRDNEQRGRPPKEEPLWLRRGDEYRNTSQADLLAEIFLRNISKGKFADGSDALKQAPVPKSVLAAKETISRWMNSDGSNGNNSGDEESDTTADYAADERKED